MTDIHNSREDFELTSSRLLSEKEKAGHKEELGLKQGRAAAESGDGAKTKSGGHVYHRVTTMEELANSSKPNDDNLKCVTHEKEVLEASQKRTQARQMTTAQEVWNAITMLPPLTYCIYFTLQSKWLSDQDIKHAMDMANIAAATSTDGILTTPSCLSIRFLPNLYAVPPLTVIVMALGFIMHSPCSIYYHLMCAFKLPPGPVRIDHWTRRLDQAMIHFMGLCFAYSLSGNKDYFLVAAAFNIDSMYRLFQKEMRPRRTLYRLIGAFLIPVLPLIARHQYMTFLQLIVIYSVSGWLFSAYPADGWSHGVFHLVICLSNPILLHHAAVLSMNQEVIANAAQCFLQQQ
mmetsp:Transcript_23210/g.28505  ORF Transcript_23210/g.28505 Transcript_23210/m.28505 type:complete len:346 (+) Transcript_23210:640-1677(+)